MQAGGRRFDSDPLHLIFRLRTKVLLIVAVVAVGVVDPRAFAQSSCRLREVFRSSSFYSLDSIAVISPDDVWVTGESENTDLVHWDGSAWTLVHGPEPSQGQYDLAAVGGVLTDEVWAVGQHSTSNEAVILHWDGSSWKKASVPRAGRQSSLQDVVAFEGGRAFAVGAFLPENRRGIRPLIYRYNGTEWRRETMRFDDKRFGLTDVDGTSIGSNALWAVPAGRRFVVRRRQSGWQKIHIPKSDPTIEDVAVALQGTAWFAVHDPQASVYQRTALGWERFEVPNRSHLEHLFAIDATSSENVWTAGFRITGDHAYPYAAKLSAEGSFEYVEADDPGWIAFRDIKLDATGGVWAVGEISDGGIVQRGC